jgi:toxin ParE1/3/4
MIRPLKILTQASEDIKEITIWYKNIFSFLTIRFVSQLYDGFAKIKTKPGTWFNITKRIKRYELPDFPYLILFFKENEEITVFAVIHERRNPTIWKQRFKQK